MKLSVVVPCMNRLDRTAMFWPCLAGSLGDPKAVDVVLVDNGSTDGTAEWCWNFARHLFGGFEVIRNIKNVGIPASLNQGAAAARGDLIAFLHNDLFVCEWGWDRRLKRLFLARGDVGMAGFGGARGVETSGMRREFRSNLSDAELHGGRYTDILPVAVFDGMAMIVRKSVLDDVGGLDAQYPLHHYYDLDLSLAVYFGGWRNVFIGVACHHGCGQPTEYTPQWPVEEYGLTMHADAKARFSAKWGCRLPLFVPDDMDRTGLEAASRAWGS